MTKIAWDQAGERRFETGIDRGVFYDMTSPGVPWNGLVSVDEAVSGGEATPFHYDGVKYLDLVANEDYQATLSCFTYPDKFLPFDGLMELADGLYATLQPRMSFGLCYRTRVGNDVHGTDYGYKLHLVYNATASPADKSYSSISNTADVETFGWTINAVPPPSDGLYKPTAHFIIDETKILHEVRAALESALYGTDSTDAYLPTQAFVIALLASGGDIIDGGAPDWPDDDVIDGGFIGT